MVAGKKFPVALAVGRLNKQKDFPTLFKSIASFPDEKPVRLIVLGEGEERLMLEEMMHRHGNEQFVDMRGSKKIHICIWPTLIFLYYRPLGRVFPMRS